MNTRRRSFSFLLAVLAAYSATVLAQVRERRVLPVDPSARQTFEKQIKVALLVGVGNYPPSSGLGALKYPVRDVNALGEELERQGYLVRRLSDTEASRGIVRRSLNELATALDPNQGTFLFYFSGHGFQQEGRNYLATFGATADDLKGDGLAVADVEAILKGSHARQSIMFIDACRNDPGVGSRSAATRTFAALTASEGLRVLYSSRSGSVSYESDQLRQGVFTHFLVEGLKGEAAGSDGLVTFRDVADYVRDQVRAFGVKVGQIQVPFEAGESSGDFLLARVAAVPAAPIKPVIVPSGPRAGEVRLNDRDGQRYVWIPSGKFVMGCSTGDGECFDDEKPAHEVEIANGFWLGQTSVTSGAWKRYRTAAGKPALPGEGPLGRKLNEALEDENFPAVGMTWYEAKAYCEWGGGRLPSEAEWEYAARAGSTAARYGSLDLIAWYADNSGKQKIDSTEIRRTDQTNFAKRLFDNGDGPHAVGRKEPNTWNLYDILGNVRQWTADWYDEKYYGRSGPRNPLGPPGGTKRSVRGGSWDLFPRYLRASDRDAYEPQTHNSHVGVRCVGNLPL